MSASGTPPLPTPPAPMPPGAPGAAPPPGGPKSPGMPFADDQVALQYQKHITDLQNEVVLLKAVNSRNERAQKYSKQLANVLPPNADFDKHLNYCLDLSDAQVGHYMETLALAYQSAPVGGPSVRVLAPSASKGTEFTQEDSDRAQQYMRDNNMGGPDAWAKAVAATRLNK